MKATITLALFAMVCAAARGAVPAAVAAPDFPHDTVSCQGLGSDTCYRVDQMDEFAETAERMVNGYFDQQGITGQDRPRMMYITIGRSVTSACTDAKRSPTQGDRSLNYCSSDNTVYAGQAMLWDAYRQFGSAGTISGLAHEYGHFLQAISGVPLPASPGEAILNEDQADCVSGAFMGFLRDRGDSEVPGDEDSVERYLTATASVDVPGRDHGTAAERIASFDLGYTGALPACSGFYPGTPLASAR